MPVLKTGVTKVNDVHSGVYALRAFTNLNGSNWITPFVSTDSTGFPFLQNFDFFNFWMKCQVDPPNVLKVYVVLYDTLHNQIGSGFRSFDDTIVSNYFSYAINCSYTGNVKYGFVRFEISPGVNFGSYIQLDDLEFSNMPLGISEENNQSEALKLFPNPAHDKLFLRGLPNGKSIVTITDYIGRIVFSENIDPVFPQINLKGISPGLYTAIIRSGNQNVNRKIVVE